METCTVLMVLYDGQPLWKTIWKYLKKLNIELSYDPAVLLPGINPKEVKSLSPKDICTLKVIAVLFRITKVWKQPKYCWLWFSHSVVSYSLQPHELQHARLPSPSPSPPLLSPSPHAFNLSQHPGLFYWVRFLHQVAKVVEVQLQHQSFQWIQSWFSLGLTGLISLQSKGLSRAFSNNTVQRHLFFRAQPSLWSNSHIHL